MSNNLLNRVISIHQPNYLPWLGYFYKIYKSDIFVLLDDVQYSNKGMHNYTYLKTPNGPYRLKYPVRQSFGDKIYQVSSKDELNWKQKHLEVIRLNYSRATFFNQVFNDYREILLRKHSNIVELNVSLIEFFVKKMGFTVEFVYANDLSLHSDKEDKLIEICKLLNGTIYYSGTGAKEYQNEGKFREEGLSLIYSDFISFEYPQLWQDFQSNVSVLDYFMNCGYDWDRVLDAQKLLQ